MKARALGISVVVHALIFAIPVARAARIELPEVTIKFVKDSLVAPPEPASPDIADARPESPANEELTLDRAQPIEEFLSPEFPEPDPAAVAPPTPVVPAEARETMNSEEVHRISAASTPLAPQVEATASPTSADAAEPPDPPSSAGRVSAASGPSSHVVSRGEGPAEDVEAASSAAPGRPEPDYDAYRRGIRLKIERAKRYPPMLRRMGLEGRSKVSFRILADGRVSNVRISARGPSPLMDEASTAAVRNAAPFDPPPGGDSLDLSVDIVFRLN